MTDREKRHFDLMYVLQTDTIKGEPIRLNDLISLAGVSANFSTVMRGLGWITGSSRGNQNTLRYAGPTHISVGHVQHVIAEIDRYTRCMKEGDPFSARPMGESRVVARTPAPPEVTHYRRTVSLQGEAATAASLEQVNGHAASLPAEEDHSDLDLLKTYLSMRDGARKHRWEAAQLEKKANVLYDAIRIVRPHVDIKSEEARHLALTGAPQANEDAGAEDVQPQSPRSTWTKIAAAALDSAGEVTLDQAVAAAALVSPTSAADPHFRAHVYQGIMNLKHSGRVTHSKRSRGKAPTFALKSTPAVKEAS